MENNETMENQTVLENIAENTKGLTDGREVKAMGEGYKAFSDADTLALKNERELDQRDRELDQRDREIDIQERQKDRELDLRQQELDNQKAETEARIEIAKRQERAQIIGESLGVTATIASTIFFALIGPLKYASTIHEFEAPGDYIHNDKNKRPPKFK